MSAKTAIAELSEALRVYNNALANSPADAGPELEAAEKQLERARRNRDLPADYRQ